MADVDVRSTGVEAEFCRNGGAGGKRAFELGHKLRLRKQIHDMLADHIHLLVHRWKGLSGHCLLLVNHPLHVA